MRFLCLLLLGIVFKPAFSQRPISVIKDPYAFELVKDKATQELLLSSLEGFLSYKDYNAENNPFVDSLMLKNDREHFTWLMGVEKNFDGLKTQPRLIKAIPQSKSIFKLKVGYFGIEQSDSTANVGAIFTLFAKESNGKYYIFGPLNENTKYWHRRKVGQINYCYPFNFDVKKARSMARFNKNFAKKMKVKPLEISYYKFLNPEHLFQTIGFDYVPNMYYSNTGGLAYPATKTLFAGNNSEQYEHEVVHFYTRKAFPNLNSAVDEGYATYAGGSGGIPVEQLAVYAKNYLSNHPEADVCKLASDLHIRVETNAPIGYIISGLICKDIEEKYGFDAILKFYKYSSNDGDYLDALSKTINIDKTKIAAYISKLLTEVK